MEKNPLQTQENSHDAPRRTEGPQPPDPRPRLPRAVHAARRRHDRERRPALHPGRSRLLGERSDLGRQRLLPGVRRVPPPRRQGSRPARPPARARGRARRLRDGLRRLRPGPELRRPRRRPRRPGPGRRVPLSRRPVDPPRHVPKWPAAHAGAGRLGGADRHRGRDRAPRGRRARRALRLALGLPHQRPRRPRGRAARAPRRPGRPAAGHGARAPRRARRAPRDRSAARLHAQRGPDRRARLALGPDAERLRRRDRPGDRRVPARAALAGAAHPARAAAVTDDPGGQHDDAHRRGRAVRDVLLPHPVHADRAGLGRVGDRRRLPAVLVRHGRHQRRRREVARRALGARAAARRARHRRGRTVAHERSGGDERVHREPAARPGRDGVRARSDVRAPHQRRHRRRGRGRRRRRVRPADDVPADRRGARHRGHGHDRDAPDRCAVAAGTAPAVAAVEGFQAAFRVQAIVLAAAGLLALLLRAEPRARPRQEANPGSAPRATSAV